MVSKNFDVASEIQNMRDATNSVLERSRADRKAISQVVTNAERPQRDLPETTDDEDDAAGKR